MVKERVISGGNMVREKVLDNGERKGFRAVVKEEVYSYENMVKEKVLQNGKRKGSIAVAKRTGLLFQRYMTEQKLFWSEGKRKVFGYW